MQELLTMADFYPTKTSPKQTQIIPHPPDKIDIILNLMDEVTRLKQVREDVAAGERKADEQLRAEMYITQLIISADKIIIDGLKETNINLTQNNYTQIDIAERVNDLIQFSRERQCNKKQLAATS